MAATPSSEVSVSENQQPQQQKMQIYSPSNDEVSPFWRGGHIFRPLCFLLVEMQVLIKLVFCVGRQVRKGCQEILGYLL